MTTAFSDGRLTVYLSGELDQHQARETLSAAEDLLDRYLPRDLVLDLGELSFMDSSGIALIVRISRKMKEMGGRMWIENPGRQPRRVLETAGVERMIPIAARSL